MSLAPARTGGSLLTKDAPRIAIRVVLQPDGIRPRDLVFLLLLTLAGILIHGYRVGVEDQAIYLPSIKKNLDPDLFPSDSQFFLSQTKWSVFDELVALSARVLPVPLNAVIFLWHIGGVFLLLLACLRLMRLCFDSAAAQWAGVALVVSLLTLPIAGTLALMVDQYLHPRVLATAAAVFALVGILEGSPWSLVWLAFGAAIHPQVTFFAACHLLFLWWRKPIPASIALSAGPMLPPTEVSINAWKEVMLTRRHHFPLQWTWYEWLGAYGPVVILFWFWRLARKTGNDLAAHISSRLVISCSMGIAGAVMMNVVPALNRFMPAQPMRQLHLVYLLMILLAGGFLGEMFLHSFTRRRAWRWAVVFVPLCAILFAGQQQLFAGSRHLELPGLRPRNEWLAAFEWIRLNTPKDALFALDPRYMEQPGEDFHGFRALAERSMLADYTKDRGVAAIFPSLAEEWKRQVDARAGWKNFDRQDFRNLRSEFGVTWTVLPAANATGLACPYANPTVKVCKVD